MFLFVFASLWVLMAEDKVNLNDKAEEIRQFRRKPKKKKNLCARASKIGTKHDNPWSLVGKLLAASLETVLEQLEVTTTAITALLVLDLVLNDERLVRNVNWFVEWGRDCVVRRDALRNETEVALNDGGGCFFDQPFANIREDFITNGGLLSSLRGCPPVLPALGKLFEERSLDFCGLQVKVRLVTKQRTRLGSVL